MNQEENKKLDGLSLNLNLNQVLNAVSVLLLAGLIFSVQTLKEDVRVSASERLSLQDDIKELKTEVKFLRNLLYSSIQDQIRREEERNDI